MMTVRGLKSAACAITLCAHAFTSSAAYGYLTVSQEAAEETMPVYQESYAESAENLVDSKNAQEELMLATAGPLPDEGVEGLGASADTTLPPPLPITYVLPAGGYPTGDPEPSADPGGGTGGYPSTYPYDPSGGGGSTTNTDQSTSTNRTTDTDPDRQILPGMTEDEIKALLEAMDQTIDAESGGDEPEIVLTDQEINDLVTAIGFPADDGAPITREQLKRILWAIQQLFGGTDPEPTDDGGEDGNDGTNPDPDEPEPPGDPSGIYDFGEQYEALSKQIISLRAMIGSIVGEIARINDMIIPDLQGVIDGFLAKNADLEAQIQQHTAALMQPGYDDERRMHLQAIESAKRQIQLNNKEINKLQVKVLHYTRIAAQVTWHLTRMKNRLEAELNDAELALQQLVASATANAQTP